MDIINIKIDVTKITKSKLFKGENGTYLNATLVPTPNSKFSDYMIVEQTTREEYEAGEKGVILGNASIKKHKEQSKGPESKPEQQDDDLPW